ncbi:hypothetical protein ACSIGC_03685 [Tenacibaculum sp. ZS6-P6]|uniref:hypothetical protein n=1 Tax=Tenacibaculum sp. ZS6-P6 TaxID=3447503 RepID=UPI003F9743A0
MYIKTNKLKENKSNTVANSVAGKINKVKQCVSFLDNRSETITQRKLMKKHSVDQHINNSNVMQLRKVKLGDGKVVETDELSQKQFESLIREHAESHPNIAAKLEYLMNEPPTTIIDDGVVKINPEIMYEGLQPEPDFSRKPIENDFHKSWGARERDPYNRANPNWLPPLPKELKGKEKNDFMKKHNNKYPTVKIASKDTFTHFTTKAGAEGMNNTEMMYPSVDAGIKTTHYGRGVYFSSIGKEDLQDKTHGDITKAIYTHDSAENRERSDYLAEVDMRDKLVLEYALDGKDPVFMHPTSEPVDVQGNISISNTASHVIQDERPKAKAIDSKPKGQEKKKLPNPPKAPIDYSYIQDWEYARKDYETAKSIDPETYGKMSFPTFLEDYSQNM